MDVNAVYRRAGLLERYHVARQSLKLDSCVIAAAKFVNQKGEQLTTENFFPALAQAVNTHAALSAGLIDENGSNPTFYRISAIAFEKCVYFLDKGESDLASVIEDEFMQPFDVSSGSPLWRIRITRDNIIIFAWHHAIGDGQSGLACLRTLLGALNGQGAASKGKDNFQNYKPPTNLKLVPAVEDLTDCSVSVLTLLREVSAIFIPQGWAKKDVWTGNNITDKTADVLKTNVRLLSIPAPSASRLVSLARTRDATLTSVLYVLAISTLSRLVVSSPGGTVYTRLSAFVPVSFRPMASVPPSVMCECISSYHTHEPLLPEFSWDKAMSFKKELHAAVPNARETVGALKFLFGQFESFFKGKVGKKREGSLALSNIGRFDVDTRSEPPVSIPNKWRIENTYLAQDDTILGSAIRVNVVGSPNVVLNISFTWAERSLPDEMAETFVKDFESGIKELLLED